MLLDDPFIIWQDADAQLRIVGGQIPPCDCEDPNCTERNASYACIVEARMEDAMGVDAWVGVQRGSEDYIDTLMAAVLQLCGETGRIEPALLRAMTERGAPQSKGIH